MHKSVTAALLAAGLLAQLPTWAADYNFNVLYSGGGVATLAPGSDDPVNLTLWAGDNFNWTIAASAGDGWHVDVGGGFFPLMALAVNEAANRIGDYAITLSLGAAIVFTESATDVKVSFVHMGTNTISLPTGLSFDHMALQYHLTSSIEDPDYAVDPLNLQPTGSTPNGLLPIFGAPELNTYGPGISYGALVPEPTTWALMLSGLVGVAGLARRRAAA